MSENSPAAPAEGRSSSLSLPRRFAAWRERPNPILTRELRQLLRLRRTPWLLMIMGMLSAFFVCSIAGSAGDNYSRAELGQLIYQLYFSVAWFFVTLFAPAIAANSIAAEREGRTWDSMLLTGMSPKEIIRGKFQAALVKVLTCILFVAPIVSIAAVFGGTSPSELLLGFALLAAFTCVGTAFGLALSSAVKSVRMALSLSIALSIPMSSFIFGALGFGGSALANEQWPGVPPSSPAWLPLALLRADLDIVYALFLVLLPGLLLLMPLWLLYEVACNNVRSPREDRAYGIKCWHMGNMAATLVCSAVAWFYSTATMRPYVSLGSILTVGTATVFGSFLLAIDSRKPSRRVQQRLATAFPLRRWLGPNLARNWALQTMLLLVSLGLLTALGASSGEKATQRLLLAGFFTLNFCSFTAGLLNWMRSRESTAFVARVTTAAIVFVVSVVPWLVAATIGITTKAKGLSSGSYVIASISPFYAIYSAMSLDSTPVIATVCSSLGYGVLAAIFGTLTWRHCKAPTTSAAASVMNAQDKAPADAPLAPKPIEAPPPDGTTKSS